MSRGGVRKLKISSNFTYYKVRRTQTWEFQEANYKFHHISDIKLEEKRTSIECEYIFPFPVVALAHWNISHLLSLSSWASYYGWIIRSDTFNYDVKHRGASAKPFSFLKEDKGLSQDGFFLNHTRVLVGSGVDTYEKGKSALQAWRWDTNVISWCMSIL